MKKILLIVALRTPFIVSAQNSQQSKYLLADAGLLKCDMYSESIFLAGNGVNSKRIFEDSSRDRKGNRINGTLLAFGVLFFVAGTYATVNEGFLSRNAVVLYSGSALAFGTVVLRVKLQNKKRR